MCPTHWRSARCQAWCDSIRVIKIDAALQQDWKQIAASLPEGDPRAADAYNQAWLRCWMRSDIWELLKETEKLTEISTDRRGFHVTD